MNQDWYLAGKWNNVTLLGIDTWNGQFNDKVIKHLIGEWMEIRSFWKDNQSQWLYASKKSEVRLAQLAKKLLQDNSQVFHAMMDAYYEKQTSILKRMDEIDAIDFSKRSNEQLIELFWETRELIGFCGAYDWLPFSFERTILEAVGLDAFVAEHPEEKDTLLSFTVPDAILPTLAEEIDVLKLAKKAKGMSKEEIREKFKAELAALARNYGHLTALVLYPLKTADEYAEQTFMQAQHKEIDAELHEKQGYVENVNKRLRQYIEAKHPPEAVVNGINTLRKLTEMRAVGELNAIYCFTRSRKMDAEIQKRLGLSKEDYFNLFMDEIEALLQGKKPVIDFDQRKKLVALKRDEKGKIVRLENAEELFDQLQEAVDEKKEMKGMPCCPGEATGTVRLINSSNDIKKFQPGDILVAPSTCVDYVMIMKKAGAIITEFGGITSHAAVVSREFKVPSVIGIPQVMKILKDGDKVHVDAKKGIVRKIQ